MNEGPIEVVITGGPCAGKTTGLVYLSEKLRERGFRVFTTPEVSTTLITGGLYDIAELQRSDRKTYYETQREFVLMQRDLGERFRGLAACFPSDRRVILHDRAELDTASYLTQDEWKMLCRELQIDAAQLRDSYDAVIHMVTVARDAPELYSLEGNSARQEGDAAQAVAADEATLAAWVGHPRLRIIDNSSDFTDKLNRVLRVVLDALGEPELIRERRFLLASVSLTHPALQGARAVESEQVYLTSADPSREIRLRRRAEGGQATYFRVERRITPGLEYEHEEGISEGEYSRLLLSRDVSRRPLRKTRYHFTYGSTYCRLDIFDDDDPSAGMIMLSIDELAGEPAVLPPFVIECELDDDFLLQT